jgi:hypothetical protein
MHLCSEILSLILFPLLPPLAIVIIVVIVVFIVIIHLMIIASPALPFHARLMLGNHEAWGASGKIMYESK